VEPSFRAGRGCRLSGESFHHGAYPFLNIFEPDAELGVRLRANAATRVRSRSGRTTDIRTNSLGFRGREARDARANDGYVDTKVGLEWKPAKQRFGIDHGALGIHLDSGYRIALRARHGGLGLYLRTQF